MKLTKQIIQSLKWPQGATHLRVDCAGGKFAVADRKSAPVSFDGIEGELTFGAEVKDGKSRKFVPLANGKVDMASLTQAQPVAAQKPVPASAGDTPRDPKEIAKDADERKAGAPSVKPEPKAKKESDPNKPREHTQAWKSDVAVMKALHNGNEAEAKRLAMEWYKGNESRANSYVDWARKELEKLVAVITK